MLKFKTNTFKFIVIFSVLITISSCSDTYRDYQKVNDMQWYRTDVKTFELDIPKDGNYDLYFAMRHSSGYPFRNIGVKIEQITPEGNELSQEVDLSVVNEKDEYKGEVIGMLWDIEDVFSENTPLKKGKYTFKISHIMNSDPVILVIDIGLKIRKAGS